MFAAIVLCGGQSRRMGRSKALLPFGPETLLQRVVRILSKGFDSIVVAAAPGQELPPLADSVRIVRDNQEHLGPLSGLATGLEALPGNVEAAFVTACDVPFLTIEFAGRVRDRLGEHEICMPNVGGWLHPLAAAYRPRVAASARELLASGRMRPVFLTERCSTRWLAEADFADVDPTLRSLRNVNSPEEYAQALREMGEAEASPSVIP